MDVSTRHNRADVYAEVNIAHPRGTARVNDGLANLRALLFVQRNVRSSSTTFCRGGALYRRPRAALQSLELLIALRTGGAALGAVLLIGELASLGLCCLRRAGTLVLFKLLCTAVKGLLALAGIALAGHVRCSASLLGLHFAFVLCVLPIGLVAG